MRHRLYGLVLIAIAALFGWLVFAEHLRSAKAIIFCPLLGATGVWLLVFGYPVRQEDGLAPGWWRLGLLGVVIASCIGTCMVLE